MQNINQSLTKLHSITRFLRVSSRYYLQNYNLSLFLRFLKNDPEISSIIKSLQSKYPSLKGDLDIAESGNMKDNLMQIRGNLNNFEELVAFCIYFLDKAVVIKGSTIIDHFLPDITSDPGKGFEKDKERFLNDCIEPIVIYIELQIKHSINAAYILQRYKMLCELYEKDRIRGQQETDITKHHLSKFLFDCGFTYSLSETNVQSGRIDNFAINIGLRDKNELSNLPNVIIAEGKIYENDRSIFNDVFNQVHKRIMELNFGEGYCVIFNKSNKNIVLDGVEITGVNSLFYRAVKDSKIYFLIVNLHDDFYASKKLLEELRIDTSKFIINA